MKAHFVENNSTACTFKQRSLDPVTAQLPGLLVTAVSPTANEMTVA